MHYRDPKRKPAAKKKSRSLLMRVAPLVLAFVVIAYLANRLATEGLPARFAGMMQGETPTVQSYELEKYTEEQKKAVVSSLAGFWVHDYISGDEYPSVHCKNRLEIKDNGIIWQEMSYRLYLSKDSAVTFTHVRHGAVAPFGFNPDQPEVQVSDLLVIRQVYLADARSCYGPSHVPHMWRARTTGDELHINGEPFQPFASTRLDTFFTPGSIDFIDRVDIRACVEGRSLGEWGQKKVLEYIDAQRERGGPAFSPSGVVARFFIPLFCAEYGPDLLSQRLPFRLNVSADGSVEDVVLEPVQPLSSLTIRQITQHLRSWKFPFLVMAHSIEVVDTLPACSAR